MAKLVLYAGELKACDSILGIFDGSEQFAIATPWFNIPGAKPVDAKKFLELKTIKDGNGNAMGAVLTSPTLLARRGNNPFTTNFVVGYTEAAHQSKSYWIRKPFNTPKPTDKRAKVDITPATRTAADDNLVTIDYQLCVAMDVLLVSNIVGIELKRFEGLHDDKAFFITLCEAITAELSKKHKSIGSKALTMSEEFFNTLKRPPVYAANEIGLKVACANPEDVDGSRIKGFYETFMDFIKAAKITAKFGEFNGVLKNNGYAVPDFRMFGYQKKDTGESATAFQGKMLVNVFQPNDEKNFYITNRVVSKGKTKKCEASDLFDLWNASIEKPEANKHAKQDGCIFLVPRINYGFYKQGNPSIQWRADKIALAKSVIDSAGDYEDGDDFVPLDANELAQIQETPQYNADDYC